MEKTEITLEYTEAPMGRMILPKKAPKTPFPWQRLLQGAAFAGMGFLWGRLEVLEVLHPMGLAFLSAFFGEGMLFWGAWLGAGLGALGTVPLKAGAGMAAALAIQLTMGRFVLREEMGKKALLGAFAAALAGIFYAISQQGLGFYFAVAAMETSLTLVLSYLLQKSICLLLERKRYFVLTREETLSLVLLCGGGLAGLRGSAFSEQWLLPVASAFFLLLAARQEGIGGGAAAGVFLSFLLLLCGGLELSLFAALSLGGLLAGCLKEVGRLASALAMALVPCIFLYNIAPVELLPQWSGGLLAGAVLFVLLPPSLLSRMGAEREREGPLDRYTRMKELTEDRLLGCAAAFRGLAESLQRKREEKEGLSELVDTIAGKVCQGCGLAHYCWEEELYRTYGMTFSALSACEAKGRLTSAALPEAFRETCPRLETFAETVNHVYDLYCRDRLWHSRLAECRGLVGQQMEAVSSIMERLSGQLEVETVFLEGAEEELTAALKKQGLHPIRVLVTEEKKGGRRQVRITMAACGGKGLCRERILPLVRKTLGCPMTLLEESTCSVDTEGRLCSLHFREEPAFAMTTATAFQAAQEGKPTGDAAAFLETERGHALLALSDGMGSGAGAARESRMAIELLEQFTEAGFERALSVDMINSALLLGRGEETYATLDICDIDLFSGQGEFVKLGAAASYLWRNGRIISLRTTTLPAGILQEVTPQQHSLQMKDGDLLFLVTDGITDALGGEEETALWMKEKLLAFPVANPQDAADYILQEAKKDCRTERKDDMTVLAGRFWRRRR
ncbi:MAG: SpoIIE family protein phosphatase [Bacillota bacterium]|nr:SpoIIE family protein phosphatase [Bacillota bacterium]